MENLDEKVKQEAKSNMGAGMADGLMMMADPLGILLQYACQKKGYDIRTIGGLGFFSKLDKTDTKFGYHTTGHIATKTVVGLMGANAWANPLAWPYLLGAEATATGLNIFANVVRYVKEGTLKKPVE